MLRLLCKVGSDGVNRSPVAAKICTAMTPSQSPRRPWNSCTICFLGHISTWPHGKTKSTKLWLEKRINCGSEEISWEPSAIGVPNAGLCPAPFHQPMRDYSLSVLQGPFSPKPTDTDERVLCFVRTLNHLSHGGMLDVRYGTLTPSRYLDMRH